MQLTVRFDPKPRGVEFSIPFTRAFALRFLLARLWCRDTQILRITPYEIGLS